jgi:serine/threonine-protein kinase HipA
MSARTLVVSLHGIDVGHLWADGTHTLFQLHASYLDAPRRPVLGQYFEDRLLKRARRVPGMHPWFENLLPEREGALRRRLARGLDVDPADSIGLLAALGSDLPGAVRVREDEQLPPGDGFLDEHEEAPAGPLRFSLGGVQLKFSLSGEPDRLSVGLSDGGGAAWILKLGSPDYPDLAENEHAIMTWCRLAGFDVPETRVIPVTALPDLGPLPDTATGFLVRRYDRAPASRVHQEDFAQVLNLQPFRKYEVAHAARLLDLVRQILGSDGAEEALRRLVAVVATGNCDAHLKNWSLLYPDGIRPALAPLYDQVATIAYPRLSADLAMRIGHARHLHQVAREHLLWVGAKGGVEELRCGELISQTLEGLRAAFREAEIPNRLAAVLIEHWSRVPLLRAFGLR